MFNCKVLSTCANFFSQNISRENQSTPGTVMHDTVVILFIFFSSILVHVSTFYFLSIYPVYVFDVELFYSHAYTYPEKEKREIEMFCRKMPSEFRSNDSWDGFSLSLVFHPGMWVRGLPASLFALRDAARVLFIPGCRV